MMFMKSIALIVGNITKTGGTERATVNLASILLSLDYKVTIISLNGNNSVDCYYDIHENIEQLFLELPMLKSGFTNKIFWYSLYIKRLRKSFKQNHFDIIIGTGHGINSLLPIVSINMKIRLIACEHIAYNSLPFISNLLRGISYRFFDYVVVLSSFAETKFKYLKNVKKISNSLSFIPTQTSDQSSKQLLAIGRLSTVKGFDRLIKIAALIKDNYSDWKIRLVGEGELKEQLVKECKALNIDDFIIFAPFTKNIEQEYLNSSIYLLTSYSEAFPMVLLEAKACGLPIVSFNCPEGPADIINDGVDGYLIEDGDFKSFADKLSFLMENEVLRKQMSINAKHDSFGYAPDRISLEWKSLLDEMLIY